MTEEAICRNIQERMEKLTQLELQCQSQLKEIKRMKKKIKQTDDFKQAYNQFKILAEPKKKMKKQFKSKRELKPIKPEKAKQDPVLKLRKNVKSTKKITTKEKITLLDRNTAFKQRKTVRQFPISTRTITEIKMKRRTTITNELIEKTSTLKQETIKLEPEELKMFTKDHVKKENEELEEFKKEITEDPETLFNCGYDPINPNINISADFNYSLDHIKITGGLDNYDKMFFNEIFEMSDVSNSSNENILSPVSADSFRKKILSAFLDFRDDKDKYFYNKSFCSILSKELTKTIENNINRIDQLKYTYIKKFGVLDLKKKPKFEFSFFSNFYLNNLEEEYLKMEEGFETNDNLKDLINVFNLLESNETKSVLEMTKMLKEYKPKEISMRNKIAIESIIRNNSSLLDPNNSFKYNNLTGYICHIVRDIIFFFGFASNINHSLPENYNNENYYRFLMDKLKFYKQCKKKLQKAIN